MLNIEINYQVKVPHKLEALFRKLGLKITKAFIIEDDISLSVAFISPQKMKELNKRYRGKNKVTDVLSFDDVNEIIICYSQAVKQARQNSLNLGGQAKQQKHSIKKEISNLFIHGFLHLLGFDDKTKKEAIVMEKETEKILLFK